MMVEQAWEKLYWMAYKKMIELLSTELRGLCR